MKDQLVERVLAAVMGWESAELVEIGQKLQILADVKYDEYDGFRAGEKFLESLSRWLYQFEQGERETALRFVLKRMVFVSRAELEHGIELVYPDIVRPMIRRRSAKALGISEFSVATIAASSAFRRFQRGLLVLGLADGARLDKLRRASPELSHEQFFLVPDFDEPRVAKMRKKLREALNQLGCGDAPDTFTDVLLVDDFTGSGFTLIRQEDGEWGGKLISFADRVGQLKNAGHLAQDAKTTLILYLASHQAAEHVRDNLQRMPLEIELRVVHQLSRNAPVVEEPMVELCKKYYDSTLTDQHKRADTPLGFRDCALPLVLSHNTPNNSIVLLWGDTSDNGDSDSRHALFPRYERHHQGRP